MYNYAYLKTNTINLLRAHFVFMKQQCSGFECAVQFGMIFLCFFFFNIIAADDKKQFFSSVYIDDIISSIRPLPCSVTYMEVARSSNIHITK